MTYCRWSLAPMVLEHQSTYDDVFIQSGKLISIKLFQVLHVAQRCCLERYLERGVVKAGLGLG
jgi:hypothetical protein